MLRPYLDLPYAFFGHSMGALISFELARQLRRHHQVTPTHIFVSGRQAPQLPDTTPAIHHLPAPEFVARLRRLNGTPDEVLHNAELMGLILPTLRADFAVCETYVYTPDAPFDCSISAFGGLQDDDVDRDALAAWQAQTRRSFTLRLFPGNHFFLLNSRALLLQALYQDLTQLLLR
jgi:medium-chain acyl-[acyl-carrier-protein] hydrolase